MARLCPSTRHTRCLGCRCALRCHLGAGHRAGADTNLLSATTTGASPATVRASENCACAHRLILFPVGFFGRVTARPADTPLIACPVLRPTAAPTRADVSREPPRARVAPNPAVVVAAARVPARTAPLTLPFLPVNPRFPRKDERDRVVRAGGALAPAGFGGAALARLARVAWKRAWNAALAKPPALTFSALPADAPANRPWLPR